MLVSGHRRVRQEAAHEMLLQSLEQECERERQRMIELFACLREELRDDKQRFAVSIYSQSEAEESARRQERIKQLRAQIGDNLLEAVRKLQR
jgi:F0F1-type ATP synthase membrane subunit b/b'